MTKNEESPVKQRLIIFIKNQGITVREFERRCGVRYGYVNNLRVNITPDKLEKIKAAFPEMSSDWVLRGTGKMLEDERVDETDITSLVESVARLTKVVQDQETTIRKLSEQISALLRG